MAEDCRLSPGDRSPTLAARVKVTCVESLEINRGPLEQTEGTLLIIRVVVGCRRAKGDHHGCQILVLTATASVQKTIQQSESKRSFNFNTEETERRSSSQVVNLLGTTFPKPQKQRQHFRAAGSNFTGMTCLVEMTPRKPGESFLGTLEKKRLLKDSGLRLELQPGCSTQSGTMFQCDPDGQTCRRSCTCQRSLRFRPVLLTALCLLCSQVAFQLCGTEPRGQRLRCLRLSAVAAAPSNGLEIGDAVTATVVSVTETWVDADVEGFAGGRARMHKSDLTTLRIRHAREVVKVGDVVKCFVKQLKQDRPVLTMQDVFANRTRLSELQPGLACDAKVVHVNKHIGAFVDVGAVTSALVPRNDFEGWTEGANLVQPPFFPASGVSVQWLSAVMIGVVDSWEELCPKTKGKKAKAAKKEKKEQKPVIHQASAQRTRKKVQAGPVPLVAAPEPEVEPETDDNWAWAWAWAPPPSAELELDFFAVPKDRDGDAVWDIKVGPPPNIKECIEVPVEVPKVKATDWTVQESWEDMCDSDAGSTADESRTMERTLPLGTTVRVEVTKVDTSKGHITAKLLPDSTEALTD
eukprot:s4767_g7.t2